MTNKLPGREVEGVEQSAFFTWLRMKHPHAWEHAFHVPNGGSRVMLEAKKLKAQGVRAGVPDIFIELPRRGFHGLRVEFKATPPGDARVSDKQKAWVQRLNEQGYFAQVVRGLDDLIELAEWYLGGERTVVLADGEQQESRDG